MQNVYAKLNKAGQSSKVEDGLEMFPVEVAAGSSWPASHGVSIVLCCTLCWAMSCHGMLCCGHAVVCQLYMLCCALATCPVLCCIYMHAH